MLQNSIIQKERLKQIKLPEFTIKQRTIGYYNYNITTIYYSYIKKLLNMQNTDDKDVTQQQLQGSVGFATPGLTTDKPGYPKSNQKLSSKVQDRYAAVGKAEDLNSDLAEDNMKQYLINSPISKDAAKTMTHPGSNVVNSPKASKDGKPQLAAGKTNLDAVPINSPKFGQKKGEEANMKLEMSKISQEDISNRKTIEEILEKDNDGGMQSKLDMVSPMPNERGFNSSGLSGGPQMATQDTQKGDKRNMQKRELEIQTSPFSAKKQPGQDSKTIRADMAKEVLIEGQRSPKGRLPPKKGETVIPGGVQAESARLQKLENMKEYVQHKKVMDYESETIELYEMLSELFDYDLLRKESPNFIIKQYKDSIFRGEVNARRKREGKGVIVYEAGRIYEGEWAADKRHGRGYELFSNGNTYQGDYVKGKAEGKGAYTWRNGEVYDGEWRGAQKEGYGVWKGIHGDSYIGQWVNSKAEGYGVHTWLDGDRYEGEWVACLRHGNGTDFFANGDVYTGQYREGRPEGHGQYKWANGNQYTGEFKQGQKHGKGKWRKQPSDPGRKSRCNQYDGHYEMDKKHGFGVFQWESGNKYTGNYHYDERQGYGTMEWTDLSKFKGHWVKGVQEGIGIMIFPDGTKRAGFFNKNVYSLPLKARGQIRDIEHEMPEEIVEELLAYLAERNKKINQMKDDGLDVQSQALESERDFMGQEFKPKVEHEEPSEDENIAKMNQVKAMNDIGKQINENHSKEPYVNHEGLRRVYKPREEREASALKEQAAREQAARERAPSTNPLDRLEDIWPTHTAEAVPTKLKSKAVSPRGNQSPFVQGGQHHELDEQYPSARPREMVTQTSLNMSKINAYNFDDLKDPQKFKKRKQSRHMETQTNLQMETINRYEALTQGQLSQDEPDKNHSSSKGQTQNLTRAEGTATYTHNNPENQISEFGQINDSQEFNKKQHLNNLDKSITLTDIQHKNSTAERARQRAQAGQREKYTSEIDINIDGKEINKSFNESDKILKETVKVNKAKMIQTIQNNKKENRNNLLLQNQDDITSFDGSDVQPAPAKLRNKPDQKLLKSRQPSTLDNHLRSPSTEELLKNGQPRTTTNKQYQEKPTMPRRGSSSWYLEQEKKKVVISQSSQLPSDGEENQKQRAKKTSNNNKNKQAEGGTGTGPGHQQVLTSNHREGGLFQRINKFSINSKTDDEQQMEDDQYESVLPSIQGRSRMSNNNQGFKKRFEQAQAQNHRTKRNKFMMSQNMSDDGNEESASTPEGRNLKFNEFELLPRMRETYHGVRPNPENLYDVQKRINNYQSDGQHGPFHSNLQPKNYDTDSIEESRAKIITYPQMLQSLQAPANHSSIQQSMNMNIQDPVQNSVIVGQNLNDSLIQSSYQLNNSYQIPPLANLKKKKKGKRLKTLRNKNTKGQALIFNTNANGRGSPIRIGGDSARRAGSIQNHVVSQSKHPVSGLKIAPMNYLSQVGNNNLHSTSNKMASIYKQPLGGFKKKKSIGMNQNQISQFNPNFQSMSTSHGTNPAYNFQMQSLSQNNYNQLVVSDSQNMDYAVNQEGIDHLKKRKISNFLNAPILAKKSGSNSREESLGQNSNRSNRSPLPNINQTPLNNLKYHQNNNSIQAIDIGNNGEEMNMNSNASLRNSPSNDQTGKKKRKRVWIPASSLRRVGLNAPALIQ